MRLLGKIIQLGLLAAIGGLCAAVPPAAAAAAQSESAGQVRKQVLVLYDEDRSDFPGLAQIDRMLRESFRSELGKSVEIHSESMDLSQFERPGYDFLLADFYRRKYASNVPDLIVAVLEPALDFLLRHSGTLFPGVPVVFGGVDASTVKGKTLRSNFTGVLVKRTFSPTLEVALRLQPQTRNVFVVGGASTFDKHLQTFVRRDLQPYEGRVGIDYLFGLTMDEYRERLSSLPVHSVVLYVTVIADGSGHHFVPHEALASIAAAANAPVYVFLDQFVGLGAVGGNVYSLDAHGAHVAALGLQILRGASPASLPIRETGAQVDLFDDRQLRRWNLDESRLPPGSVVRHRDLSVWVLYRWYILAAIAGLLVQGALIGGLLVARARQHRAEVELQQLHVRLGTVEEDERRTFHRELHDRVGGNLAALRIELGLIQGFLGSDMARAEQHLRSAHQVTQETMAIARNLMTELGPPALDQYGLVAALRSFAESQSLRLNLQIKASGEDLAPRLAPIVETALFRIVQEAVTNAAKHASAERVDISVSERAGVILLKVEDDGEGFEVNAATSDQHWGLKNMNERARAIGARIRVRSSPGAGTRIAVELSRAQE